MSSPRSCISFESYIKPQLALDKLYRLMGCISFESYIKPQHFYRVANWEDVVYLLNPTSNHHPYPSLR